MNEEAIKDVFSEDLGGNKPDENNPDNNQQVNNTDEHPGDDQNTKQNLDQQTDDNLSGPTAEDLNDPASEYWKDKASAQGWVEDFTPKDGQYQKTPREFVKDGEFMGQLHRQKQDVDRLSDEFTRKNDTDLRLQKVAYESKLQDLEKDRDEAVGRADTDEFDRIQKKIDTHQENKPAEADKTPEGIVATNNNVKAYQEKNDWLNSVTNPLSPDFAKASFAHMTYNNAIVSGKDPDAALRQMEQATNQAFPDSNPNRQNAPSVELGKRNNKRTTGTLNYGQLSRVEQHEVDLAVDNGFFTRDEAVKKINEYRSEM